ncbi:calcineurin-binding cabin-1 [Brachionus plicatilis]|uniref:Calcineurin-binding cabin-1 n=1 Tax=Brachionus plicatilis TaxID=10195 RepID=A0A3M7SRN9_BRAPC|nr:calcineurin-binding cabin-1 [Brachionus plicatilis]
MNCGGLQALGSDSEISEEEVLNESLNAKKIPTSDLAAEKSSQDNKTDFELRKKETENLYESYKDGLKNLASKDYDSANKIFESILLNPIINAKLEVPDEIEKDLQKLKYILLKNLSLIQNKQSKNYKFALEYLIQAATIDGTDINLWYEIGCLSLKIGRLIVAKVSFEECLNINPHHWPSLDQLIVILFSLGNFTNSLEFVFNALRMDKAYINGLIILKKIDTDCGIDIDEILDQAAEHLYDDLMSRVNNIKIFSNENLNKIKLNTNCDIESVIEMSDEINSWKSLGNFILMVIHEGKFNLLERFKIKVSIKDKDGEFMDSNSNDGKKDENYKEENLAPNEKSKKRKQKFDCGNIEDGWWKRRSLRKGIEKNDQNDKNIADILKIFFSDNMLWFTNF